MDVRVDITYQVQYSGGRVCGWISGNTKPPYQELENPPAVYDFLDVDCTHEGLVKAHVEHHGSDYYAEQPIDPDEVVQHISIIVD